jgi:hypothetical protein
MERERGRRKGEEGERRAVCVDKKGCKCKMKVEGACNRIGLLLENSDKGE